MSNGTITFQYMASSDGVPNSGYEITDAEIEVPTGFHVPRVGEFIQLHMLESSNTYLVLAVNTRISMFPTGTGWHSYVTVGPVPPEMERVSRIRE